MLTLSPRQARRLIVFPAAVAVALALNLVNLGIVFFLREERGATAGQIGLYTAAAWLAYCVGCHVMPPRFASRSAARVVMGSLSGLALCMLAVLYIQPLAALYIVALVQGICLSLFWPVVMSWASHKLEAAALNRAMGWFNLSWSTGMILGPLIAGWLCDISSVLAVALGSICFSLMAGWIVAVTLVQPQALEQRTGLAEQEAASAVPDQSTPLRFPCWLGLWATFIGVGMLMTVFPLVGDEQMGISRAFIGTLFLLRSLLMAMTFAGLARVSFWHHRSWPLLGCMAVLGVLHMLLVPVASAGGLIIVFCLIGVFGALGYNMSLFHGAAGSPDRTSRMAVHESLIGAGLVVGAFGGGWLAEHAGAQTVFYATGGMFLVIVLVQSLSILVLRRGIETARVRLQEGPT